MKFLLYDWGGLNVWLFQLINNWRGPFIDRTMLMGSQLGDHQNYPLYMAAAIIGGLITIANHRHREDLALKWFLTIAVFSCGYLLEGLIITWSKHEMDFPRPIVALSGMLHVVGPPEYRYSLPSAHAAFAVLVALSFWYVVIRPLRIALTILPIWVSIARVNIGAHFPADVIAGILLSALITCLLRRLGDYILFSCTAKNSVRKATSDIPIGSE